LVLALATGCGTPTEFTPQWIVNMDPNRRIPSFTGTVTGLAEKHELHSRDGEAYPVTAVKIASEIPECSWLRGLTIILVDACYTAYPPESYTGKSLKITGTFGVEHPLPFPGGPMLFAPPPREPATGLTPINIFIVKNIEIVDSGTTRRVEAISFVAKRTTKPCFTGTWIGRAEKKELRSKDGRAFPVTAFGIERLYRIDKPQENLPVKWPTVNLADRK